MARAALLDVVPLFLAAFYVLMCPFNKVRHARRWGGGTAAARPAPLPPRRGARRARTRARVHVRAP
jgi:hypothetical protein